MLSISQKSTAFFISKTTFNNVTSFAFFTNQVQTHTMLSTTTSTNKATKALINTTATNDSKKQKMAIASVKASSTKVKTVNLVITTTAEFKRHMMPQSDQPCSSPFVSIGKHNRIIKHRCELTRDRHLHSAQITQTISVKDNPIPPKAEELILAVEFHESVDELAGFTGKQTTATLYKVNESIQIPCCTPNSQSLLKESCTIQNGYHIHSTTKPIFVHSDDIPVPAQACGFRQHFAYSPNTMDKGASIPRHWEKLDDIQKKLYIDDIVACFNRNATYSIIANRHGVYRGNVIALLREGGVKPREKNKEAALARSYRVDRYAPVRPKIPKLTIAPLYKALMQHSEKYQESALQPEITTDTTSVQPKPDSETPSSKAPLLSSMLKNSAQPIFEHHRQVVHNPLEEPLAKRPKLNLHEKNSPN